MTPPPRRPRRPIRYFAYGSNLSREQMQQRCPTSTLVGPAVLPGHRIAFTRWSPAWGGGVADVVEDPHHEVWGLLHEVQPADLDALDHYEGHPEMYVRDLTWVATADGPVDDVWVYRVREKADHVPPTETYLDIMLEAADTFGFPADHLAGLRRAGAGAAHPDRGDP